MRSLKFLVLTLVSMVAFAACSEEKRASLVLDKTSLYFSSWEDTQQIISYVAHDAEYVAVGSISEGWNATVNAATSRIIVIPVGSTDDEISNDMLSKEGLLVVNAVNKENQSTSYDINLYICDTEEIDSEGAANCYVVTKPNTNYTFDAMHRHDGSELATKSVKLLWQSNPDVVKNVALVEGKAMFYISASADDSSRVTDTNAVVAAYNAKGETIWSWHLWVVNENPLTDTDTYSNGKTFMRKNLGAFTNSDGSKSEQKIYDSYGMYYQWGRKDPFPRPYYFDASGAESEGWCNEEGTYLSEDFVARTAKNGTVEYAIKNPMQYIYNDENSEYNGDKGIGVGDWLAVGNGDDNLWGENTKSLYDPCPYGWKVPSADDLSVLYLSAQEDATDLEEARKQYGWRLSDDLSNYFWSACGRRRYTDGKVENMNYKEGVYPSQPQPWEGYYWTSSISADGNAAALYFDLTTTRLNNKFVGKSPRFRANGFQIRCVKE